MLLFLKGLEIPDVSFDQYIFRSHSGIGKQRVAGCC